MTLREAYQKIIQIGKSDMRKTSGQKYKDMFDAPYSTKSKCETHLKAEWISEQLSMFT